MEEEDAIPWRETVSVFGHSVAHSRLLCPLSGTVGCSVPYELDCPPRREGRQTSGVFVPTRSSERHFSSNSSCPQEPSHGNLTSALGNAGHMCAQTLSCVSREISSPCLAGSCSDLLDSQLTCPFSSLVTLDMFLHGSGACFFIHKMRE